MSLQLLREQRAEMSKALSAHAEKKEWDPATDGPEYDKRMAAYDRVDSQIKAIERANEKLAEDTRTALDSERLDRRAKDKADPVVGIVAKWLRGGDKALNDTDWSNYRAALATTAPADGGFTVPTELARSVIELLKAYGGMRSVADVITTESGANMDFPASDGTSEEGEIVAENGPVTDSDPQFGLVTLNSFMFSSKGVAVPMQLLQDSGIDIAAFVNRRLTTRIGRIQNRLFTTGTGAGQPHGIVTAATSGKTAASATAFTYDELVDLQHSVDAAYRERGTCAFMMNDTTLAALRKLKDSQNRPIFVPGYEQGNPGGAPDRLLGAPIRINYSMPNATTGLKPILWGDFKGYTIRDVMQVSLFRFTDSAYARKAQVGFLALMRSGGNLLEAGAVRALTMA